MDGSSLLNFAVLGEVRSGTSAISTAVNARDDAACHLNLFHLDDLIRQAAHEDYYGESVIGDQFGAHYQHGLTNPFQYLSRQVWDNPLRNEQAVGCRIDYGRIRQWELWDLFRERGRDGDFCLIHVVRNPIACYVSLKQAEKYGHWGVHAGAELPSSPPSVPVDVEELVQFCRWHVSIRGKIRGLCEDVLEISYRNLCCFYQETMRDVFEFLELPDRDQFVIPKFRRLRNRPTIDRLSNVTKLRFELPGDLLDLLDKEDLF